MTVAMWGDSEASSCTSLSTMRVPLERINQVKAFLEQRVCSNIGHEPTLLEDITLVKGVSPTQFKKWAKKNEETKAKEWGMKVEYYNESIVARELPSRRHGTTVSYLATTIFSQDGMDHLISSVNESMDIPSNERCIPDFTIHVRGDYGGPSPHLVNVSGGIFPTIVVEVGVAQTIPDLCDKLNLFQQVPSLQYYLVLKLFANDGMLAMMFNRAVNWGLTHVISFGPVPLHHLAWEYIEGQQWGNLLTGVGVVGGLACSAPGIPVFVIQIPSNVVFNGRQGGVPPGALAHYDIDLFRLQQLLLL